MCHCYPLKLHHLTLFSITLGLHQNKQRNRKINRKQKNNKTQPKKAAHTNKDPTKSTAVENSGDHYVSAGINNTPLEDNAIAWEKQTSFISIVSSISQQQLIFTDFLPTFLLEKSKK
ncbi:hypothetical protein ERO13_A02G111501v2 [Gossypium hirsutum]|nr:hypothetical protein ERO13_A02G111501v2 [Gossypium hirsutum]